jgi:hypothetical protein
MINFKNNQQQTDTCIREENQVNYRACYFGLLNINTDKKVDNLYFKGTEEKSCVNSKDLKVIKSVLGRCRYMSDVKHMINSDRFKVTPYKNAVIIDDYYSKEPDGDEIYGLCAKLSYKVMEELEEKFGNKYKYLVISGNQKSFSMLHFCVAVCPNILDKNYNDIKSLPENTLIIDPAFGIMGLKDDHIFKDYEFEEIEKDGFVKYYQKRPGFCDLYYDEYRPMLLGKVELLAPGLFKEIESLDKNALIRYQFCEPYKSKYPTLYLWTCSPQETSYLDNSILQKLSKDELLKQWIDKIDKATVPLVDKFIEVTSDKVKIKNDNL